MVAVLGSWLVWTPDPSGCARKGLGNNLARKCLAGMPRFLNSANFIFQILNAIGQVLLEFSNFYVLPYIHFLSLVELEHWLAEMRSFPHQHWRSIPAPGGSGHETTHESSLGTRPSKNGGLVNRAVTKGGAEPSVASRAFCWTKYLQKCSNLSHLVFIAF